MTASEAKPGAGFVTTFGQFRVCGVWGSKTLLHLALECSGRRGSGW